jgi:hypothetical protein
MKCPNCGTILFNAKTCKVCHYDFATEQVDYSKEKRVPNSKCPKCGSTSVIEMPKWKRPTFHARIPVECLDCRHSWEPPTSRILLALGVPASVLFTVGGIYTFFSGGDSGIGVGIVMTIAGVAAFIGCIKRLAQPRHSDSGEGTSAATKRGSGQD